MSVIQIVFWLHKEVRKVHTLISLNTSLEKGSFEKIDADSTKDNKLSTSSLSFGRITQGPKEWNSKKKKNGKILNINCVF